MWARKAGPLMLALALMSLSLAGTALADGELETVATSKSFAELQSALEAAVTANEMIVVTRACASQARPRHSWQHGRRRLPERLCLTHAGSKHSGRDRGTDTIWLTEMMTAQPLSYRHLSTVFAPYCEAELDSMAKEFDVILEKIVDGATK